MTGAKKGLTAVRATAETAQAARCLRIGGLVVDPPILQAPMAGFTNVAFRQVVREYGGVGLQATEHSLNSAYSFAGNYKYEFLGEAFRQPTDVATVKLVE